MIRLHPRFYQPMTPELMDELKAYRELYDAEVERVRNVLNTWPTGGVLAKVKPRRSNVRRLNLKSV